MNTSKQTEVLSLVTSIKFWIAQGGNSAHSELVQAAEALQAQHAELRQWRNVFGHLGTADECGNEWIALKDGIERKNALLERALDALSYCEPHCFDNPDGFKRWSEVMPPLREEVEHGK